MVCIMILPKQIWKDIEGFENYQVNQIGQVRSLNYRQTGKVKRLKFQPKRDGYLTVCLYKDGKPYTKYVHRLVAEAFILNPNNLPQVNHIDEDKANNHVNNLEWCDAKYNSNYGTHNERMRRTLSKSMKGKNIKPVLMLSKEGKPLAVFDSFKIASQYLGKSNTSNISHCCRGLQPRAYGYKWKYINIIEL